MKISEKQIIKLISIARNYAQEFPGTLVSDAIYSFLKELVDQQSDELKDVE